MQGRAPYRTAYRYAQSGFCLNVEESKVAFKLIQPIRSRERTLERDSQWRDNFNFRIVLLVPRLVIT